MLDLIYSIMPGIAEMTNLHPVFVHFPIALLSGFLLMEVIGFITGKEEFTIAAKWMLYLGTLGTMAAIAAGLKAEGTLPHNEIIHTIMEKHETFGFTVLALSILLSLWRIFRGSRFKTKERAAHIVVGFVMLAVMSLGADLGGLMVYKHGAGVKAVPMAEGHEHNGGSGEHGAVSGDKSNVADEKGEQHVESGGSGAHLEEGNEAVADHHAGSGQDHGSNGNGSHDH